MLLHWMIVIKLYFFLSLVASIMLLYNLAVLMSAIWTGGNRTDYVLILSKSTWEGFCNFILLILNIQCTFKWSQVVFSRPFCYLFPLFLSLVIISFILRYRKRRWQQFLARPRHQYTLTATAIRHSDLRPWKVSA